MYNFKYFEGLDDFENFDEFDTFESLKRRKHTFNPDNNNLTKWGENKKNGQLNTLSLRKASTPNVNTHHNEEKQMAINDNHRARSYQPKFSKKYSETIKTQNPLDKLKSQLKNQIKSALKTQKMAKTNKTFSKTTSNFFISSKRNKKNFSKTTEIFHPKKTTNTQVEQLEREFDNFWVGEPSFDSHLKFDQTTQLGSKAKNTHWNFRFIPSITNRKLIE